jgi:spore coat protein U-like protein
VQGNAVDTASTISYNCWGFGANTAVRICFRFAGFNGSGTRSMGGAGTLNYQLYTNSARTLVAGNPSQAGTSILQTDDTTNGSGVVTGSVTVYGRILAGQNTQPDGAYTHAIGGANPNQRMFAAATTVTQCSSITTAGRNFAFNASATIANYCNVSATNLNFGNQNDLSANRDQTSMVTIRCTNTIPYNIGLGAGMGAGATVAVRKMTSAASNTINYSLYRNAARSLVWGETIGTNTLAGTGSGANQSQTVYGRIPVQALPNPGTYSDTIVLTVTY